MALVKPSPGGESGDTLSATVKALSSAGAVSRVLSADIPSLNGKPAQFFELFQEAYLRELRTTAGDGIAQTELVPGTVSSGFAVSYLPRITGPGEVLVRLFASLRDRPSFTAFTSNSQTIQLPAYACRAIQVTQKIGRGETLMVTGFSDRSAAAGRSGTFDADLPLRPRFRVGDALPLLPTGERYAAMRLTDWLAALSGPVTLPFMEAKDSAFRFRADGTLNAVLADGNGSRGTAGAWRWSRGELIVIWPMAIPTSSWSRRRRPSSTSRVGCACGSRSPTPSPVSNRLTNGMVRFWMALTASLRNFCSWLGLSPGTRISGDKRLGGPSMRQANRVGQALRMAASTARNSKTALGAAHRRRLQRMDPGRAVKATAHQLARLIYALLTRGEAYVERNLAAMETERRDRQIKHLQRQARHFHLALVPAEQAA